jgi:hypothetical protein
MFFDATQIPPTTVYEPLPAGDYEVIITESQMKPTKNGMGEYLELKMEIQSGPFQGRNLWDRLNLKNPNPKTVEIAQRTLSQLCHAVNVLQPRHPSDLHNRPMVVKVAAKMDEMRGEMVNEIKGYKAKAAPAMQAPAFQAPRVGAQPAAQPPTPPQQPTAPTAGSTPPWAVKA